MSFKQKYHNIQPIYISRMLKNICPLPLKANTYYGCVFGCLYCYSNMITKTRTDKYCDPIPLDYMRRTFTRAKSGKGNGEIHKCIRNGWAVQLGNMADPFQENEVRYQNTYKFLRYLDLINYPCVILTKSDLCTDSMYLSLYDNCQIIMSIASLDPHFSENLEGNAPSPRKRLKALSELVNHGIKCTLSIAPLVWGVNDNDTVSLIEKAADIGVSEVTVEYLRLYANKEYIENLNSSIDVDLSDDDLVFENYNYYMLNDDIRYKRLSRIKQECNDNGLRFYSVNSPVLSGWKCCCGEQTQSVNGKALLMQGNKLKDKNPDEYLGSEDYPFRKDFCRQFHKGLFSRTFYDLKYNKEDGVYESI